MNKMTAAVAAVLILSTVFGARKGLLRQALSLGGALICLWLVTLILPYSQELIRDYTPVEHSVSERVDHMIADGTKKAVSNADMPDLTKEQQEALSKGGNLSGDEEALARSQNLSKEDQNRVIENVQLPQFLKKRLVEHNNNEIYSRLGVNDFVDYVKEYLTELIVKILAYVLSFVLAFVIFKIILFAAHIVDHLPLARGLNKALGALLGLAMGLIIVGLFFALLVPMYATDFGKACFAAIEDSTVLTFLYQHNPIMAVASAFTG